MDLGRIVAYLGPEGSIVHMSTIPMKLAILAAIFKELKIDLAPGDKEHRIKMQKIIYLVQREDDLGYTFGWYLNGPYSSGLADEYYRFREYSPEAFLDLELDDESKKKVGKIKRIIDDAELGQSESDRLELFASFCFCIEKMKMKVDEACDFLTQTKPRLKNFIKGELLSQYADLEIQKDDK